MASPDTSFRESLPPVTAVISTHDRKEELRRTLESLAGLKYPRLSIIVADNASTDGTREMLAADFPRVEAVHNDRNDPMHGYNLGFRRSATPYVLVLDDDSCPEPGSLERMAMAMSRRPDIGAAAANIVRPDDSSEWDPHGDVAYTESWNNLIGCGFLIRRQALRRTGGYNESFMLYYNDMELALRLLANGYKIAYSRDWTVEHRAAPSNRPAHRKTMMMARNFPLIVRSHFGALKAADLIMGHSAMILRRAAREGCLGGTLAALAAGLTGRTGRNRLPLPDSEASRAFVRSYSFAARLRHAVGRPKTETSCAVDTTASPVVSPPEQDASTPAYKTHPAPNRLFVTLPRARQPMVVPRFAAAIVTYNKREAVLRLLGRLAAENVPAFVTTNACKDGTAEEVRRTYPAVSVLESAHNLGGTGGFNCAVLAALSTAAKYIVLIDDDAVPEPGCLDTLADFLDANPEYAFAAPAIYIEGKTDTLQETGGDVVFNRPVTVEAWNRFSSGKDLSETLDIGYASACLLMVRAETVARAGVMDWNYFIFSDDVDWCVRLRRQAGPGVCVTAAKARHDFPWAKPFSPARLYYFHRNGLYMNSRLREQDPLLASLRYPILRMVRDRFAASLVGDTEVAATLKSALNDARASRWHAWAQPVAFPSPARRKLTETDFGPRKVRRVLLNIRIEDVDLEALAAIRGCVGRDAAVEILCDGHRTLVYKSRPEFSAVWGRRNGILDALRLFLSLRWRGYDLAATDATQEPRGLYDMVGRRSVFYHNGALYEARCRPFRAVAARCLSYAVGTAASWILCWRFLHRPEPGRPPVEAAPLLRKLGVDPAVGQPWARDWATPFSFAPLEQKGFWQRLRVFGPRKARELLARVLSRSAPPSPPGLLGGETSGGFWTWCKARGPAAPLRYAIQPQVTGLPFSVLVPVCDPPAQWLRECIDSVRSQTWAQWELILADDASTQPHVKRIVQLACRADKRVRSVRLDSRGGISAATNAAAAAASGAYLVFLDHDDILDPFALTAFAQHIATVRTRNEPEPGVIYADEDRFDETRNRFWPAFKPEYSPELLLATNYIHHPVAIRTSLFRQLGGLRSEHDGSQDHDLVLRAAEAGAPIVHLPDILYHMRVHAGSLASGPEAKPLAHKRDLAVILQALSRRGENANVEALPGAPGLHVITRRIPRPPSVSVIVVIAAEGGRGDCLSHWQGCEVLFCDGAAGVPKGVNRQAQAARGEVLIITSSIVIPQAGWAEAMLPKVFDGELGLATGKLVFGQNKLFCCGLTIGSGGAACYSHFGCNASDAGYCGWMAVAHEVSAVPKELMAVRREVFIAAGGLDEDFSRSLFDVELSLRLRCRHRVRHVAFPAATFRVEMSGPDPTPPDWDQRDLAALWAKWGPEIRRGDPCYNPNLSLYDDAVSFLDEHEHRLRVSGAFAAYDAQTAALLAERPSFPR